MEEKMEITVAERMSEVFAITAANNSNEVRESTTQNTARLFNALNGSAETVKSVLGETIEVEDIVITSADINEDINNKSEDATKVNVPVVHFFTTDGRHFSSISAGIRRGVKNLFSIGLLPTKEHPIRLNFKITETKKGIAHTFDLCD